jgi:hypothetical protein
VSRSFGVPPDVGPGADVTQGELDAVAAAALQKSANLADLDDAGEAKTNLALVKADVGLGNVTNTSDTAKPVSIAQQTALDLKAPLASPTFTGTVAGVTKAHVGLGSVDNTADTAKPVSTAQATALGLKADKARLPFNVKDYGATGDGTTDDTAAIAAAHTAAKAVKGEVFFPPGNYLHTGDLTVDTDYMAYAGVGQNSKITFAGGGLVLDGTAIHRFGITARDLRIVRTGSAGPAISLAGNGSGTGVVDWHFSNVAVYGSTGDCLTVQGSYIGTFVGCTFRGGAGTGVKITDDPGAGPGHTSGNLITFVGGEIQGCAAGAYLENCLGVNFFGVGIEGHTTSGVEIYRGGSGYGFFGCYFESNGTSGSGGWDIKVGTSTSGSDADPKSVVVRGSFLTNALGVGHKTASIHILRGRSLDIGGNTFYGYEATDPVTCVETFAGTVQGVVKNNTNVRSGGYGPVISGTYALLEHDMTIGAVKLTAASATLKRHFTGTAAPDFTSIAAGTTAETTITVTGAAVGDDATAHPNSAPEAGLMWAATVTAANTVTLRLANVTSGAIDPVARTWRINVWGH